MSRQVQVSFLAMTQECCQECCQEEIELAAAESGDKNRGEEAKNVLLGSAVSSEQWAVSSEQ